MHSMLVFEGCCGHDGGISNIQFLRDARDALSKPRDATLHAHKVKVLDRGEDFLYFRSNIAFGDHYLARFLWDAGHHIIYVEVCNWYLSDVSTIHILTILHLFRRLRHYNRTGLQAASL